MRRLMLCLGSMFVLWGLTACGGGSGGDPSTSGGGGSSGTITSSNISLPSSVQVVSAH